MPPGFRIGESANPSFPSFRVRFFQFCESMVSTSAFFSFRIRGFRIHDAQILNPRAADSECASCLFPESTFFCFLNSRFEFPEFPKLNVCRIRVSSFSSPCFWFPDRRFLATKREMT